ncbi:hypothetical protein BGX34_001766 [Mortierella sp. NVP85]|nr:hypothetical protein BGX34_001766 [Mortierella sp. NVP85]
MASEDPLEIPEITGLVASYLSEKDLAHCVRVSKKWRDLFLPHRWRIVCAGFKPTKCPLKHSHRLRVGPHPSDIYGHRHLIHQLILVGETAGLDKYHYPNLRRLCLFQWLKDPEQEVLLELTEMFPSLVNLGIGDVKLASSSWKALVVHPHVTTLALYSAKIKETDALLLWEVCRKLESLELHRVTFSSGIIPEGAAFDSLRKLMIVDPRNMDISNQLNLILRCPNLEKLYWAGLEIASNRPIPHINRLVKGCWPHLRHLCILQWFGDMHVATILEGIGHGSLVNLALAKCFLTKQGSKALRVHFDMLVVLDFQDCCYVASSVIRDVLCSCPKLIKLRARSVPATDIVKGGPWVCRRLRELRICFLFEKSEKDLQRDVFGHLSTLTRLERLEMSAPEHEPYEDVGILEFRLENGMGQLGTLQQLAHLRFDSKSDAHLPQMGKNEVVWMLYNWKQLKTIRGRLNRESNEDENLKDVFKRLGVEILQGLR